MFVLNKMYLIKCKISKHYKVIGSFSYKSKMSKSLICFVQISWRLSLSACEAEIYLSLYNLKVFNLNVRKANQQWSMQQKQHKVKNNKNKP